MSRSQYSPDQPEITAACVAGLFHKQSDAEDAMEELKAAGFAQSEIGIATSHEGGYKEGFWDKVTSLFGKYEHTESATELEDSLLAYGLPEDQARYFNRSIGKEDVLVTVRTTGRRAEDARTIFQQAGADIATDTAKVAPKAYPSQRVSGAFSFWARSCGFTRSGYNAVKFAFARRS